MSIIVRATQRLRHAPGHEDRAILPHPDRLIGPDGADSIVDLGAVGNRRMETVPLNRAALQRAGIVDPEGRKSRLADELRLIKRRLLNQVAAAQEAAREKGVPAERPDNTVAVTSPRVGEGKTFTALNLAISIALGERRKVVLIDGDPIKRSLSSLLGIADRLGLTDVLRDDGPCNPLDLLLACEGSMLHLMPAGTTRACAADVFNGPRMASLVGRAAALAGDDGLVVVDAPPILATSESLALAHQVGRVLMVVAAGRTSRSSIGAALDQLDMDDRISLVLNRLPPHLSPTDTTY